jgi:TonB family protein
MKARHTRFSVFCAACIFSLGSSVLPVISQESKLEGTATEKVFRAGVNGVGVPTCIYCPPPGYSKKARADRLEGYVLLDIRVTAEGKPTAIVLVKGLGEGLDEQAEKAVKSWRFTPAKDSSGNPVAARVQVQVTFHLYK